MELFMDDQCTMPIPVPPDKSADEFKKSVLFEASGESMCNKWDDKAYFKV